MTIPMTEIVDERQRLVADLERMINTRLYEGMVSESYAADLKVRVAKALASPSEGNKKVAIGEPVADKIDLAVEPGVERPLSAETLAALKEIDAHRVSRPQEQPRKATGEWRLVSDGEKVPLAECPIGLFECGGEVCLRSEYSNNAGLIDAYIVSSGEYFWGNPPQTIASQRAQLVQPLVLSVSPAAAQGWQGKPVAWLHELKEPGHDWTYMLSKQAEHSWSHWISEHKDQCEFRSTPLYAAPSAPAAQEQEKGEQT